MGSPTSRHLPPFKAACALWCRVLELNRHPILHRYNPMPGGQDSMEVHQQALNSLSAPSKCQQCGDKCTVVFQFFENWPSICGPIYSLAGKG